jgi:hypothetical protein
VAFAVIFAIIVGVGMIGQWTFSLITKQVPEIQSEPIRISFHIAAEMATALGLIVAGVGLLATQVWGKVVFLIAIGMLFYTAIVSPGYFAQRGQWLWLGIFLTLIVLAIISVVVVI